MSKKHHPVTAADIIDNLPLHRQLDIVQAKLVKLSPAWLNWVEQAVQEKRLSLDCALNTQLTGLHEGKLMLTCSNATNASQLKHQQHSLLESLQTTGFKELRQIIVRIQHPTSDEFKQLPYAGAIAPASSRKPATAEASAGSVKVIENFQKIVKNDRLANSLKKLAVTLKKL